LEARALDTPVEKRIASGEFDPSPNEHSDGRSPEATFPRLDSTLLTLLLATKRETALSLFETTVHICLDLRVDKESNESRQSLRRP
jgi:hypothetical protein